MCEVIFACQIRNLDYLSFGTLTEINLINLVFYYANFLTAKAPNVICNIYDTKFNN